MAVSRGRLQIVQQQQAGRNPVVLMLVVFGFCFATGYLIGFLSKDALYTRDPEAALHMAAHGGTVPTVASGATSSEPQAAAESSIDPALLPEGKQWPGEWPCPLLECTAR